MTVLIIIAAVVLLVLYRRWPDLCQNIVNTGLAKERREPTPVEQFHAAVASPSPPPPATTPEGIAASLRTALRPTATGGSP